MLKTFFYGNHFYGLCAVLLSIETHVQLHIPFNSICWHVFAYSATTAYYTQAYLFEHGTPYSNERSHWYAQHQKLLEIQLLLCIAVAMFMAAVLFWQHQIQLALLPLPIWLLAAIVATVSIWYYLPTTTKWLPHPRGNGWIKPLMIGFVWISMCHIAPIVLHHLTSSTPLPNTRNTGLYLLTNWLYISILCILFDIKDYASDANKAIKTWVVRIGLRKTLFTVVVPLTLIAFGLFLLNAILTHLSPMNIFCNSLPFVLLLIVTYSLHQRKSILYYLAIIDGLMLAKAIFGIAGIIFTQD